jgi:hypothetical protein
MKPSLCRLSFSITNQVKLSLVVNIIAGEVVEPERRTAVFGQLQGAIMLGQGLGFLSKSCASNHILS